MECGVTPLQSKLSHLWNSQTDKGKEATIYGFSRKFFPIYLEKLNADKLLLDAQFDVEASELEPGTPDYAAKDPITGSLCFTGRLIMPLEEDVTARVFLKYCLDGKEYWWTSVRGPRGKLYNPIFRDYFEETTTKEPR